MTIDQLDRLLRDRGPLQQLEDLYGPEAEDGRSRFRSLFDRAVERFSAESLRLFSAPGRVELGGNHTDHNGGKVLAASVHLDSLAAVEETADNRVVLYSEGYPEPFAVDLANLQRVPSEEGRTEALIRGVAARLYELGYRIGGFHGFLSSKVLPGSGLSSSASIEILLGSIYNHLFNSGKLSMVTLSLAGQFAENEYFGKPCGLMDQIACASGGVAAIDFKVATEPALRKIETSFTDYGYALIVVDTGGSHADLTPDYAAVPEEMRSVAQYFGKPVCRDLDVNQVIEALPQLRAAVGDRAILRALHFFADNDRVDRQIDALEGHRFSDYLAAVRGAGDSSWELLQNNYSPTNAREQGVPLALALSRLTLGGKGAVRIQGGGFAGTMQAYVPIDTVDRYIERMERYFGKGCATPIRIRNIGATELFPGEPK